MKRVILAAVLSCTCLTACTAVTADLDRRLDRATTVLNTGEAAFGLLVATGVVPPALAERIRGYIQKARDGIALARAALAVGDRVTAQLHADTAVAAANKAEELLRTAAPPTAERAQVIDQVASLRAAGEQLARASR